MTTLPPASRTYPVTSAALRRDWFAHRLGDESTRSQLGASILDCLSLGWIGDALTLLQAAKSNGLLPAPVASLIVSEIESVHGLTTTRNIA